MFVRGILKPEHYTYPVAALLLCSLAINLLSLALPVMTLQAYDRILPNEGSGTLAVLTVGVCVAVLLEAVLRLCRAYAIGRAGAAYEHRMACLAMQKVLYADLSRLPQCGVGEHLHRFAAAGKLRDFCNGYALTALADLAFVPVFLALMAYIAGPLVLVPLFILGVFTALSVWKGHRLRRVLHERERSDDQRFNFLIEALEGVHTIKAFALEKFFERRYEAFEETSVRANYKVTQETADAFNMGAVFSHLMVASVITVGAWCVLQGMLSTGALIAVLLLAGRMMQPIQKALALWVRYQDFTLAREHMHTLLSTPQHRPSGVDEAAPATEGRVSVQGMNFAFADAGAWVLRGIDLELAPGETVLINGPHGCGKTSLLNVIAGMYPPTEGQVDIDGRSVMHYTPEALAQRISHIRTRPLIFRGTIRDNITCFGHISEAQARDVAALLEVDRDVAKLPGGFDTFLSGSHTDSIPPGLRQRIAMTRSLATKPRILLFDHADRSLDKEGYTLIYRLMARLKGRVSMVLVSDDWNIRALADRVYQMEKGVLRDEGHDGWEHPMQRYRELRV